MKTIAINRPQSQTVAGKSTTEWPYRKLQRSGFQQDQLTPESIGFRGPGVPGQMIERCTIRPAVNARQQWL